MLLCTTLISAHAQRATTMAPLIEIFQFHSSLLNKKAQLLLKAVNHFLGSSSEVPARPEATRPQANLIHAG